MTIGPMPKCYECKNILDEKGKPKCKAFPDGIPEEIISGEVDHVRKFAGQTNDLLFERK